MIVTFTANPSVDITVDVETFDLNVVNRATSSRKDPAGKGINVSRALAVNGEKTVTIYPTDDLTGKWLERALEREGIEGIAVEISGSVRTNIMVTEDSGETTTINDVGPMLTHEDRERLCAMVESTCSLVPDWLVVAGSLPRGLEPSFYIELGKIASTHNVRFAVDSSGDALAAVAHGGVARFMKPNHSELEQLAGRALPTIGEVVDVARGLLHEGSEILISLGEHGAILVTEDSHLAAIHEPVRVESTVGAGDSTVAGYLSADRLCRAKDIGGRDADVIRLTTAVAWGSAAVSAPGTTPPQPDDITPERVRVTSSPDRSIRIEDLRA